MEEPRKVVSQLRNRGPQEILTRVFVVGLIVAFCTFASSTRAQVRGVYPLGMSATNSGVTPAPGFTYANMLLFYDRDQLTGPDGTTVATGRNTVVLDMNSFVWVSEKVSWLGDAKYSAAATVPLAKNSLTSDEVGQISGATGLGDIYFQPLILGWETKRADVRVMYGFMAPTGRFNAGANDNVGTGYWTHGASSGQTFYLSENRATAFSAFEIFEYHETQEGTGIRPGDTFSLDYSLTQMLALHDRLRLQLGIVGYEQWQTSAKSGSTVTPSQAETRYRVNALGIASNVFLPDRKMSFGFKYFREFSTQSTFEGYSLQGAVAIKF